MTSPAALLRLPARAAAPAASAARCPPPSLPASSRALVLVGVSSAAPASSGPPGAQRGEFVPRATAAQSSVQRTEVVTDPWRAEQEAATGVLSTELEAFDLKAFDLKAFVAKRVEEVNAALDAAVPLAYPEVITSVIRYSLLGSAKRLCAVLCMAAAEDLFGSPRAAVMPVACALEMIHDAALVHDDLPSMDGAQVRRGRASTHVQFGECAAVLTGDALLCRAFDVVARECRASPERALRVIALISKSVGPQGIISGQVVDLLSATDPSVTLETLQYIHLRKSAALIKSAVMCGAIVGGAAEDEIERLGEFGLTLGLLFQVADDVLDAMGSTQELGKPAGVDDAAAKATYPGLLGLEKAKLYVDELAQRARSQISGFDPARAVPLIAIVEYVRQRTRQYEEIRESWI